MPVAADRTVRHYTPHPMNVMKALLVVCCGALSALPAQQEWTDEQLVAACPGFQSESLPARLQQVGKLLAEQRQAFSPIVARIHGDHREYRLRIDRLLKELGDPRWLVRESAERTLIEIGGRAWTEIESKKEKFDVLDQQIRCARILDALKLKGTEQEDREKRLLRGLVTTALYFDAEPRLVRALRSALGHTNAAIADGAIRALGRHGGDDEADALAQLLAGPTTTHRLAVVAALARMRSVKAVEHCRRLLFPAGGTPLPRTEAMVMVRALHARADEPAKALLRELAGHPDRVVAAGAGLVVPPAKVRTKALFTLSPDRQQAEGVLAAWFGDSFAVEGVSDGVPVAELSFADCDTFDFPGNVAIAPTTARVFLNQGSLVQGDVIGITADDVRVRTAMFGEVVLPRREVQGIALDPALDRLVGASAEQDRVRLRDATFADGALLRGDASTLVLRGADGAERAVPIADAAGVLFTRPRAVEPDTTAYTRLDLVTGERLLGFLVGGSAEHAAIAVPWLGAAIVPWSRVVHAELNVGGGAMWGFTLIADYSDNCIVEVDDQGRIVFKLEEIFGAWDAECLDNNNLLITEFSVSRVQEVDRKGNQVWKFEDLKNPYDADRLPNGNTLIADTFASRVIEVDKNGSIVWSFAKDIRPFDCDRLANGNTLIADVLRDRVLEVDPAGTVVWEVKGLPNAHDADRLPNGNTLVTLRNKGSVLEIDRDGKVVFEITGLSSPSDADRLANGNTIVAENTRVREFDRRGNEVWKKEMTWAVEVNRY
jgi:hypothetical protein